MIKSGHGLIWSIGLPIALVLATSGCATKRYVRNQVKPVNQRVSKLETQTNQKIAAVWAKHQSDISAVNERISTTDQNVAQVAAAAQQAQGTADRAVQDSAANSTKIADNATAITTITSGVANALNFQKVETANVMFGFNKSTLTPQAMATLDQLVTKIQALPRSIVELSGFTDPIGSVSFNLALSRRRAESVQRYLVMKNVPLHSIHMVGQGINSPPSILAADLTVPPNASKAELHQLARRVNIQVFGAGDIQGSAARSDQ
jgi:OmpA-OmpF porin, OOP family